MKYQKVAIWRVFLPKTKIFPTLVRNTHPPVPVRPTKVFSFSAATWLQIERRRAAEAERRGKRA
jgi:hypothetical protein